MPEPKKELIELLILQGIPLTTRRKEQGEKKIYSYLPVSYNDHPIYGIIIKSMLYDRQTYTLTGEDFYVNYEEFALSVWGFGVLE